MLDRERCVTRCIVAILVCLVATADEPLAQEPSVLISPGLVRALIDAGRYAEAEAAARLLASATDAESGAESLPAAAAADLLVEALLLNGRGAERGTRRLAEQVLALRERLQPADDAAWSPSLRNLAATLATVGEIKRSALLFERNLSTCERTRGRDDPSVAEALDDLARAQLQSDRYRDAQQSLERAMGIKERHAGPNDRTVARTLELLALLYQKKADYPAARPFLERALSIRETVGGAEPDLIEILGLFGTQLQSEGDPQGSRQFYARAVDTAERQLRPDHPLLAVALRNLASALKDLGDFTEARSLRERALAIAEQNYGPSHPEVGRYLNDLAYTDVLQGDYAAARVLYERAMSLIEHAQERDDLVLATRVYNLGNVLVRLGDFPGARRQFERAIAIWQRELGAGHEHVARGLAALGEVLIKQRRYVEAEGFLRRAIRIQEARFGANHPDVAYNLATLATILDRQGSTSQAMEMSARALKIWEASNARDTPIHAYVLNLHGGLQARQGEFDSARRTYEQALAIRSRVVGNSHPLYAATLGELAVALAGGGDRAAAMRSALRAEAIGRQHLRTTLRSLPERESLAYAATRPRGLDLAMSLASDPDAISDVADALVKSRALVLDEMAARHRVRAEASTDDLAPLWAELTAARQRLANLVIRGPSDQASDQYLRLVDGSQRDKEIAERALADKSAAFRQELKREEVGLSEVRTALPARTALVAFARYDRTVIDTATTRSAKTKPGAGLRRVPSYAALVLLADQLDVSMVALGAASTIDALIAQWRLEITSIAGATSPIGAERTYRIAGGQLRKRVWDPIAAKVGDATTVFVVPDGTLNLLSFGALPVGSTSYVIDNGPVIHYLSAERDLLASTDRPTANRGLLAVGGAAFDDPGVFTGSQGVPRAGRPTPRRAGAGQRRTSCTELSSMQFQPLTATIREIREVAAVWVDSPVQILESGAANERAFKQSAPGHRVLHLATHGFFLGSSCSAALPGARAVGGLVTANKRQSSPNAVTIENPLLVSGLALAGANRRALARPGDEDGILTAEEVASLQLDGVEWAVLSACDTGLGEVEVGEGVLGLRRAFHMAGVRTVIMSLWSVEDKAAGAWMKVLYQARIRKLTTAEAVHEASLTVLRNRRASGRSTHPFYWAAFVAEGDWR